MWWMMNPSAADLTVTDATVAKGCISEAAVPTLGEVGHCVFGCIKMCSAESLRRRRQS